MMYTHTAQLADAMNSVDGGANTLVTMYHC